MRRLQLGLAVIVASTCIAAVSATSASAATPRTIAIHASRSWIHVGKSVTISGSVSPHAPGQKIVLQQRRPKQLWVTVKTTTLGATSNYRFLRYFNAPGVFQLRTKFGSVVSSVKFVTVYKLHFLADLPPAATLGGGCITTGSAVIRSVTYAHTVTMDLTCSPDVWAAWHFASGCRLFNSVLFFTDASSSDAQATLSVRIAGTLMNALTVAESDFSAPGQNTGVAGQTDLRLEANAPSGTTPIAAWGNPVIDCPW